MNRVLKGKLVKWNPEKGFGFIQPDNSSKNIFIHISDFKEKGFSPYVGEIIFYKLGRGKEGKEKAIGAYSNRKRLKHVGVSDSRKQQYYSRKSFRNKKYIFLILLGIFIMIGGLLKNSSPTKKSTLRIENHEQQTYQDTEDIDEFLKETDEFIAEHSAWSKNHFHNNDENSSEEFIQQLKYNRTKKIKNNLPKKEIYHCDGRKYCSQMRSCEEAKYFLQHCPNPKMDGDEDGIPCEGQWCGH